MRHAVARLDDLKSGAMKLVHADRHRILLVRGAAGVYALDNACPHQGYGLAQGDLNGQLLTCQWHNWKFRVDDGECVLGEEDVRTYPVSVEDGQVFVDIVDPTPEEQRARLLPSLRRGIADDYSGQIARDVVRLLQASTNPAELVWEGIAWGAPRGEFGWGHSLAMAADCLRLVGGFDDDERAFPIVQALAGIAEVDHLRPPRPQPSAVRTLPLNPRSMFRALVEAQDQDGAEALMLGAIDLGVSVDELRTWCIDVVCDHHLSFGHGAIYVQKAFELLERLGVDRAATVLPHLVPAHVTGTREDLLPYMRPAMKAVNALDLDALAAAPDRVDTGWYDEGHRLRDALLAKGPTPIAAAATAVLEGAGIEGLLDTVVRTASERLLRHDPAVDFDPDHDFGWLDITHVMTYARAARWAWRIAPGPDTARLALFPVFMAHDSGRAEWRRDEPPAPVDIDEASAAAPDPNELLESAAKNQAGSFIVAAHIVKTAVAAVDEAAELDDRLPLAAAARFASSPRLERFVTAGTAEAISFLRTGSPPPR